MKLKTDGGFIDLDKFTDGLQEWVVKEVVRPLVKHIKALEKKVEERGALKYCGTYSLGMNYEKGDAVTYAGSLWVARTDTKTRPGTGQEWTLAVKRGRDAR